MGIIDRIRGFRRIKDEGKAWDEAYKEKEKREMGVINRIRSFRRIEDKERAEEEAYKEKERREERERQQQNPEREATGIGGSLMNVTNILKPQSRGGYFFWVAIVLVILSILWWFDIWRASFFWAGIIIWIGFIIWGFSLGFTSEKDKSTYIFIATALLIWLLDMVPSDFPLIGYLLGQPYGGFDFSFIEFTRALVISLPVIMTSGITFAFLYVNMVFKIIKKEYAGFLLAFFFILITNSIMARFFPRWYDLNISIPYGHIGFFAFIIVGFGAAIYFNKKIRREIPDFFSYVFMIFIFAFFWVNTGWMNTRSVIHAGYIIIFGFAYIMPKERKNPVMWHLMIPALLIVDFFGYGFLLNTFAYEWVKFIPTFIIFVLAYCYQKTENVYALTSFIVLVTVILALSIQVYGYEGGEFPFKQKPGTSVKDFLGTLGDKLKGTIESRLDIATAGLYRGNVEKNRYESLGVYFGNIRAADPRFYTDEPITVWGTLRSKTYKDAVIVNFNCSRWKDNKRIYADKIIPEIRFPIFTLEEVDTQCTFLPKKESPTPAGANIVTLSAEYNFGTDSYLKTYFMDRERFRASTREGIDPLAQFGIKDKTPAAVYTNGPVEIGLGAGPLVTVSEGYAIKPTIGITLTNRKEIQDKDKKIITRWEGKIKNITELILLTPYGITLGTPDKLEKCKDPKTDAEKLECPCSMPFVEYKLNDCQKSCSNNVLIPCDEACKSISIVNGQLNDNTYKQCFTECEIVFDKCNQECAFLFQTNEGEGPTKEKYNAYALDVGSKQFKDLNKDIDKSRSFQCRFEPSSAVLDNTPITTRYFRVRTRYNYLLENSVTVNVEQLPVEVINTVPDVIVKSALEIKPGHPLWFEGSSLDLLSALSLVESGWRHCCQESGNNQWHSCKKSEDTICGSDKILTSYAPSKTGDYSIGFIQVNTIHRDEVTGVCKPGQTLFDKECNLRMGQKILKENFDKYSGGVNPATLEKYCPKDKYPDRYKKYLEYRREKAALRAYNGWGCQPESSCQKACMSSKNRDTCFRNCVDGTINYVEKILDKRDKIKEGKIIDSSGIGSVLSSEDVISQPTSSEEITFVE